MSTITLPDLSATGGLSSVMSFPDRGPWGDARYRGNTSGWPILKLINHYNPELVCDPAEGGRTTRHVCRDLYRAGRNIMYYGFDLRDGFNLLRDRLVERLPRECDLLFFHPPYAGMIEYSGKVWGEEPHPDDLSRCETYDSFLCKMEVALYNCFEATRRGGIYAVMIGDLRSQGRYYSMQADIIKMAPGVLQGVIIKVQHNVWSDSVNYSGNFIPIRHEYILQFRRGGAVFGMLEATLDVSSRLRALSKATWGALVEHALRRLGGEAELPAIYQVIEETASDKKTLKPNWQATVRRELQERARPVERGRWALAAA